MRLVERPDPPEPVEPLQVDLLLSRVRCVVFAALGGGADLPQVLDALKSAVAANHRRIDAERAHLLLVDSEG